MRAHVQLLRSVRGLPIRQRVSNYQPAQCLHATARRSITPEEKPLPQSDGEGSGPNQSQLPHVSEEAAKMAEVTGETAPEIDEQGTSVQEVLNRDDESKEKAPEVIKEKLDAKPPNGARAFSTYARRRADVAMTESRGSDVASQGHIFGLPSLPIPSNANFKYRYDPIVKQVTGLIMQDGKLGVAQRNMGIILNHLRTASPPTVNPSRPLVPGAPPASHLPLNPVLYMTLAIDSVAPLFRIRSQRGAAGGGVALQIPVPLAVRQRRRQAFMWILDSASKRRTKGSGRGGFAQKVAEELIAVIEGRSGVWDKRGGIHKLGVAARANLNTRRRRQLCECPDIAPDDVEEVIPGRAQCPLNIGEDDIQAANLPIPEACPRPDPVVTDQDTAHCDEYWYGRPKHNDCLVALAKIISLARNFKAFTVQTAPSQLTRLIAQVAQGPFSAATLRRITDLPIVVGEGTCAIALVEHEGRIDPPGTVRYAQWKDESAPRMQNVIKSCVERYGIGGWRDFGTWQKRLPNGGTLQSGLKDTNIYVYGPKSKQEDMMNMKYSCSVDAAGIANCHRNEDSEPPSKKPKTGGGYENEGAGDAGQGTSQSKPPTAQRPTVPAGASCSGDQDCDTQNDYLCKLEHPHHIDPTIDPSWESFICKFVPGASSDRSASLSLGSACRGRCLLANVTETNISLANANSTTLQVLPRPDMPILQMGYQCACNCTYVSVGCCLSDNGIVWEDPAAKAPLMVKPPNANSCCDGTTGQFRDTNVGSGPTARRDLSPLCAQ